ncbi:MAG: primosomal protein N' [Myxococcota bacterium]
MEEHRFVEVAVPLPVDETYDYALPRGVSVEAGCRVAVPFRGRRVTGVVVAVHLEPRKPGHRHGPGSIREVHEVLDSTPLLEEPLLRVVLRAAREGLSPPGLALAAAIPPGRSPRAGRRVTLLAQGRRALERGEAPEGLRRLLWALGRQPRAESELRRRFGGLARMLDRLEHLGWVGREVVVEPPRIRPRTVRVFRIARGVDPDELRDGLKRAPRQREILDQLGDGALPLPASPALRALLKAGWVEAELREVRRSPPVAPISDSVEVKHLTPHQAKAVRRVLESIDARRDSAFLLYGITGSGKTEVYLRATAAALERGRGAIVLVPEISLTHQVVDRFRARFQERVAVLHSGLSGGERFDQWREIREGRRNVVIGARSAIFAPVADPGLIVIDEEHDPAYKSDEGFCYHARDVALLRSRESRCPLVLGSATPDVETSFRADRGEIERLVLPDRIARRPLPTVEIVDMNQELAHRGRRLVLSRTLRRALAETLARRRQAILFLNRRGFATLVYCHACGYAVRCKHCDISLVYHSTGTPPPRTVPEVGDLRCHYCGYRTDPPSRCPGCGSPEGVLLGFGTERVAEEVGVLFPHARVERLDRDTTARKGEQRRILAGFHKGEVDVLVGTQMVAKGHDIPGVTLVGVVAADLGLHFPDFRAGERTFQLLTQVAGRAGRGDQPGRVVVQTFLPTHYSIALSRTHDYPSFYREELRRRRPHGYPPFRALGQVLVSGLDAARVEAAARKLASSVPSVLVPVSGGRSLEVLGPAPAPIGRIRDRARWQFLMQGDLSTVREVGYELIRQARSLRGVQVRVDPMPLQML